MRASRLLSTLLLLQTRGRMSATALARELGASVRTVYRDIDQLSAAGVPVYAQRGRDGGFQLLDGWRTELTGLTHDEARALFLSGLEGPAGDLGLADTIASAQLKLLAALPADDGMSPLRLSERVHLDPVGWFRSQPPTEHLRAVAAAVWEDIRLSIRYESWNGIVDRRIDPLGLVLKAGVWYVVASTAAKGTPRVYRLSNILALAPTAEHFPRPDDFELAGFWRDRAREFEQGLHHGEAQLRTSARGLRALRALNPIVAASIDRTVTPADADGWQVATIPIESVEHAAAELIQLGPDVEALTPLALRDRMMEMVRALGRLYAIEPVGAAP